MTISLATIASTPYPGRHKTLEEAYHIMYNFSNRLFFTTLRRRKNMGLHIRQDRIYSVPVILCDWCNKEIKTADDGNYQWDFTEEGTYSAPISFTHKDCNYAFDQSKRPDHLVTD
jgi:hypothetical protein